MHNKKVKKVEICAGLHLFHLDSENVWKHDHCFLQPFLAFSSSTFVKLQMYFHEMKQSHEKIVFFATLIVFVVSVFTSTVTSQLMSIREIRVHLNFGVEQFNKTETANQIDFIMYS